MKTNTISKIFSGAIFSGILFLALFGISASNVMAQTAPSITVDKDVCDDIGQQDTCDGRNAELSGETIKFTVTNISTNLDGDPIFVKIDKGNDRDNKSTSGTTTVTSEFAAGTRVRVCECAVAGFDAVPRPGDSTGGQQEAGGLGFEDCIIATLNNGNNVFKFLNDKLEPTAAGADIAGRVFANNGRAISRAIVTVFNTNTLESRSVTTNRYGYFDFQEMTVGDFYLISVNSKGYWFASNNQGIGLTENLTELTFIGTPFLNPVIGPGIFKDVIKSKGKQP